MRVDAVSTPPAGGPRRPRRGQAAFAIDPDEAAGEAAPDIAAAPALQAIALPVVGGPRADATAREVADGAAKGHGEALLHALAGLQHAVLGAGGAGARAALAALAQDLPRAADPALDAVLQAIAQRAAVELARGG
jgi:hypothetical protein